MLVKCAHVYAQAMWHSEMYGYVFAAAQVGVTHKVRRRRAALGSGPEPPPSHPNTGGTTVGPEFQEAQRKYRRTVFSGPDWETHRSAIRFENAMTSTFKCVT